MCGAVHELFRVVAPSPLNEQNHDDKLSAKIAVATFKTCRVTITCCKRSQYRRSTENAAPDCSFTKHYAKC